MSVFSWNSKFKIGLANCLIHQIHHNGHSKKTVPILASVKWYGSDKARRLVPASKSPNQRCQTSATVHFWWFGKNCPKGFYKSHMISCFRCLLSVCKSVGRNTKSKQQLLKSRFPIGLNFSCQAGREPNPAARFLRIQSCFLPPIQCSPDLTFALVSTETLSFSESSFALAWTAWTSSKIAAVSSVFFRGFSSESAWADSSFDSEYRV